MGIENKCETCSAAPFVRCDCVPDYAGIGDEIHQLRADLAQVTAERDDLRARCKFQDQRIERAIRCSDRLVDERDALRAKCQAMHDEREALLARLDPEHRESVEDWRTMQASLKHEHAEATRLRALLPTEAEREALAWLVAYSGSDTYLKTMRTALAYLDRLLGGGA